MIKLSGLAKKYADESVLVCQRSDMTPLLTHSGVLPASPLIWKAICHATPMRRIDAEADTSVIQLVSYFLILHRGKFLTHRRTKRQPEKRLTDIRSLGFSGHICKHDTNQLLGNDLFEPSLEDAPYLNRELAEEVSVKLESKNPIRFGGYIWDPSDTLGLQHLALLYIVPTNGDYKILEPGLITDARFESLLEIKSKLELYTTWSRLLINELEVNKTIFLEKLK
ncbi:MAG: hypothetical protein U1D41_16820 [Nitrosomonas sp.]|uniref:hypothetical protein n=1 Tax=Nitrosomonas sp. TaxID=42353 RepID=UPI002774A855|nr:hypothetical protein [Nitrosomonas sp.]MDP3608649.1 hypothetical protein [Methylophilus sp.]MDZ4107775.1 hypothetical protein [Nitrosomonas sp.]